MKVLLYGALAVMCLVGFDRNSNTVAASAGVSGTKAQTVSHVTEAPSGCTTGSVSGGFNAGYRAYGGPARRIRARRLARIEGNCGFRSASAGRRLGRMNGRYGH